MIYCFSFVGILFNFLTLFLNFLFAFFNNWKIIVLLNLVLWGIILVIITFFVPALFSSISPIFILFRLFIIIIDTLLFRFLFIFLLIVRSMCKPLCENMILHLMFNNLGLKISSVFCDPFLLFFSEFDLLFSIPTIVVRLECHSIEIQTFPGS